MRLHKLMELVEDLTPTGYSAETLTAWIEQCENGILVDVLLLDPAECVTLDPETDVELAVKKPYDKLYLPYVQAQVAFAQGEISRYENFLALYTAYLDEYARYICRTVYPAGGCSKLSGYYLSAYGLAVENGFEGSEEDWLQSLVGPQGEPGPQGPAGEPGREMPIAWASYSDGIYTAAGEDLPEVAAGSESEWVGKGRQMILVPMSQSGSGPKLRINGGEAIEIRRRADTQNLTEPVDQLMRGVPYVLLFCGLYWLVESPMIGRSDIAAMIAGSVAGVARSVNGNAPDEAGDILLGGDEISTQQAWGFSGNLTDAIDEVHAATETAQITANAAVKKVNLKTPDAFGNAEIKSNDILMDAGDYEDYSEESITAAVDQLGERIDAAKATANAAVKKVNGIAPDASGAVDIRSNRIKMDSGDYEDYSEESITAAVDQLGERIDAAKAVADSKGGKVELVRSGDQILRGVVALTFSQIRNLLTVQPDFVYLLDGDWAYLTTYIFGEPTDAYQYIRFSSTVIGDLRAKTSSIMVQTTDRGSTYTVTSSTINSENVSNKSSTMAVLNDTRYPTTRAVADYVAAQLAAIPFAEGVTFGA